MSGGRTAKDPGDLHGHLLPGLGYLLIGSFWTYSILYRYHVARREAILKTGNNKKINFRSSLFFTYRNGYCGGAPVQAFVVSLVPVAGILAGFYMMYVDFGYPAFLTGDIHHLCIYTFFGLTCVTHILLHYKYPLPHNSDYLMLFVTNVVEALLFVGHIHGRAPLNQKMHLLMVYVIVITAVCTAVEMNYKTSVLAALGRSFGFILTGVWLFAEGFVLYTPSFMHQWDQEDHVQVARIEAMFVGLIALSIMEIFVINHLVYSSVKKMSLHAVTRILNMANTDNVFLTYDVESDKPLISESDEE